MDIFNQREIASPFVQLPDPFGGLLADAALHVERNTPGDTNGFQMFLRSVTRVTDTTMDLDFDVVVGDTTTSVSLEDLVLEGTATSDFLTGSTSITLDEASFVGQTQRAFAVFVFDGPKFRDLLAPATAGVGEAQIIMPSERVHGARVTDISDSGGAPLTEMTDIEFDAGTNTKISMSEDGDLNATVITFDFIPGEGDGKVAAANCTEGEIPVTDINGITPNRFGNAYLRSEDDCYSIRTIADAIEIRNDCVACLSCDEIIGVYNDLAWTSSNGKIIENQLCNGRDIYIDFINVLADLRDALNQPDLRASVRPIAADSYAVNVVAKSGSDDSLTNRKVTQVSFTVSITSNLDPVGPGALTPSVVMYSGTEQLPGRAATAFMPTDNPTSQTHTASGLDSVGGGFGPGRFASWQWVVILNQDDEDNLVAIPNPLELELTGTITFDDASTYTVSPAQALEVDF